MILASIRSAPRFATVYALGLVCALLMTDAASAAADAQIAPSLRALLQSTFRTNPELAAAQARLEVAEALARAAGQPVYNPDLEAEIEDTGSTRASLGVSQAIDIRDKRGARATVAGFERAAAAAELDATRLALAHRLIAALGEAETSTAKAALARRRAEHTAELVRLAQRRFQGGDVARGDLDLATLADAEARVLAAEAIAAAAEARANVVALTGIPANAVPALPEEPPALGEIAVDEAHLIRLPRQRALEASLEAAQAGIALKEREHSADPTLRIAGGRDGDDRLLLVGLSVPLQVRNTYRDEVSAARSQVDVASAQLAADRNQARATWLAAGERYAVTREAWDAWHNGARISAEQFESTLRTLWQAGELPTMDYLTQFKQAIDAEIGGLELKRSLWRAYADWLEASGDASDWLPGHGPNPDGKP